MVFTTVRIQGNQSMYKLVRSLSDGYTLSAGSLHVSPWNTDPVDGQELMRAILPPGWRVSCASPFALKRAPLQRNRVWRRYVFAFLVHALSIVFSIHACAAPFGLFGQKAFCFFISAGVVYAENVYRENSIQSEGILKCNVETDADEE